MLKHIFIGIIFNVVSIVICYAQKDLRPGYVITQDHDTLHGKIDLQSNYQNSRKCIFQEHGEPALQVFRPADIHAYRIKNEKFYVAHEINLGDKQGHVFLEYANNFVFKSKYEVVQHDKYFSGSTNAAPTDMRIYKYGFSGGIGVNYHVKDNSYIYLQAEMENRLPAQFIRNAYDLHKIRALLLTAGYAF